MFTSMMLMCAGVGYLPPTLPEMKDQRLSLTDNQFIKAHSGHHRLIHTNCFHILATEGDACKLFSRQKINKNNGRCLVPFLKLIWVW